MSRLEHYLLVAVLALTVSACTPVWEFNGPRGHGYTIDLVDVRPTPGTPLAPGTSVDFVAKARYSLSVTPHGRVALIFEDANDQVIKRPPVWQKVDGPRGEVTLRDTITVPTDTKQLHVFIPLAPDGFSNGTGEVTILYPIERK